MEKKTFNNMILGVFLLAGIFGFAYILFNISGGTGIFSSDYTLYARFKHVKGLNFGSEVSLAGLRVGTVKKIRMPSPEDRSLLVELSIQKTMKEKIRKDTVATIRTSGVLGDKYIELSIGSSDKPVLEDDSTLISEEPKDLITKTGQVIEDISKSFHKGGELEQLIRNLNRVAENLAEATSDLKSAKGGLWHELTHGKSGANISRATDHLESILRKIDRGDGTIGALVNDPTVYEDVKSLMGGAKRSGVLKYFMKSFIDSGREEEKSKKN